MKNNAIKLAAASTLLALAGMASTANAAVINSTSGILDQSGESLLEGWLGQGDLDFTSIYHGLAGVSAQSWHAAVDGITQTISIYRATNVFGTDVLVGGYNSDTWDGISGYKSPSDTFIFNLTTTEMQAIRDPQYSLVANSNYFATFGGGHDLMGGTGTLGASNGYAYGFSYGTAPSGGTRDSIDADDGFHSSGGRSLQMHELETFTFAAATPVPEPSSLAILGLSLIGMGMYGRKKRR